MPTRPIALEDVPGLSQARTVELFGRHVNPGLTALLKVGGYTRFAPAKAEGIYIHTAGGRRLRDFVSSYGALNFGHNHPRITAALAAMLRERRLDLSKELISPYAAALAHNLCLLTPPGLDLCYFCNSGTEAVEAALKLAARAFAGKRRQFIYTADSLHGKTIGSLSVTGGEKYRQFFPLLPGHRVPYGDADAVERLLARDAASGRPRIAGVIVEPIQGEAGVILPPAGYLSRLREVTENFGVFLIVDEIQTGMGRAGYFLACEKEGVVPDIIAMAKSLGGGVCSIGATIYSRAVMEQAYPDPHDCLVQTSTFGGRSTACAAAIAALEVLAEDDLCARSRDLGAAFLQRLRDLAGNYPEWIREVRGQGLMIGIEFRDTICDQARYLPLKIPGLKAVVRENLPGMIAASLLERYNILGTLMLNNRLVLRVYPPLVAEWDDLEHFASSLEDLMAAGPKKMISGRVNYAVRAAGLDFIRSWAGAKRKG